MEKYRRNNIIESKLQQLPGADVNNLWNGMHTVLDQAMPQQDKKRRFFAWLFGGKMLLFCAGISVLGIASCIFLFKASSNPSSKSSLIANHQNQGGTLEVKNAETATNERPESNPVSQNSFLHKNAPGNIFVTASAGFTSNRAKEPSVEIALQKASTTMPEKSSSEEEGNETFLPTTVSDPLLRESAGINPEQVYYSNFTSSVIGQNQINKREQGRSGILSQAIAGNPFLFQSLQKENDSLVTRRQKMIEEIANRGVYIGVMAGFDLSTVRLNSFNPGSNKGLILGYSFNKKWSAEAGVYWNKKSFFGGAGTFDLKNYTPQSGVKILSAKGDISLYEMPVSVRYSILSDRNALFITAGISSYFMKSESYKYGYEYNGQSGYSFFSPQNASKNWLSVANLSVGYNWRIGDLTSLRVEPYLKMPVKNIGFCNMPVMSTGINIGITRKLSGF